MTPTDFLTRYTQDRNPSPHTIRAYTTAFKAFGKFIYDSTGSLDHTLIQTVTETDIRAYIATLEANSLTRTSIVARLAPLKLYFKELHGAGDIPANPFARIYYVAGKEETNRKRAKTERKLLSDKDIKKLLDYTFPGDNDRISARNRMIIHLLVDTGRRVADLCRVYRNDVNMRQHDILFNHTKSTTGEGVSPLSDKTMRCIKRYLDAAINDEHKNRRYLDGLLIDINEGGVRVMLTYALEALWIKKPGQNAHAVNHFFVTRAIKKGMGLDVVSQCTGKSVTTLLQTYNHPARDRVREEHGKVTMV